MRWVLALVSSLVLIFLSNSLLVHICSAEENNPPRPLTYGFVQEVEEDSSVLLHNVDTLFYDPDGDNISLLLYNGRRFWEGEYSGPVVRAELFREDGEEEGWGINITPHPDAYGRDTVIVAATDGYYLSNSINISVEVRPTNDPPEIFGVVREGQFSLILKEDESFSGRFVAGDFKDGENVTFEVSISEGLRSLRLNPSTGEFNVTPIQEDVGNHTVHLRVTDSNGTSSAATFWFNVTNSPDMPIVSYVHVKTKNVTSPSPLEVIEAKIVEVEPLIIRCGIVDEDVLYGVQESVQVISSLSDFSEYTLLWISPGREFLIRALIPPELVTHPPYVKPLLEWIEVLDPGEVGGFKFFLCITVENRPDPPENVSIVSPREGETLPILFHNLFVASNATDLDLGFGDNLTYLWDFDASNGFQWEAEGQEVYWDFKSAGTYVVTLRVYDSTGFYAEDRITVFVEGYYDPEDYDNDGMPNLWEEKYDLNVYNPKDAEEDLDGDGLSNYEEYLRGTSPLHRDTDGDGRDDSHDFYPLDSSRWSERTWTDRLKSFFPYLLIAALGAVFLWLSVRWMWRRQQRKEEERAERRRELQMEMERQKEVLKLYQEIEE